MKIDVPDTLHELCIQILSENKSEAEWAIIESDDMFQGVGIEGGFDSDEMAFCFAILLDKQEYWFQLTLDDVGSICSGHLAEIDVRPAERFR